METPKQLFQSVVKGKNFLTPKIIGFYKIFNGACELSTGYGFLSQSKMYGVTVVQDNKHNHDLSKSFHSLESAKDYISQLKHNKVLID